MAKVGNTELVPDLAPEQTDFSAEAHGLPEGTSAQPLVAITHLPDPESKGVRKGTYRSDNEMVFGRHVGLPYMALGDSAFHEDVTLYLSLIHI